MTTKLWCIYVPHTDSVAAQIDRAAAERAADAHNSSTREKRTQRGAVLDTDPHFYNKLALVELWPGTPADHATTTGTFHSRKTIVGRVKS